MYGPLKGFFFSLIRKDNLNKNTEITRHLPWGRIKKKKKLYN